MVCWLMELFHSSYAVICQLASHADSSVGAAFLKGGIIEMRGWVRPHDILVLLEITYIREEPLPQQAGTFTASPPRAVSL